jgi:hypothetical protein
MRLYHLLPHQWGLVAINNKRIKISRFSDLNDPFELFGARLLSQNERVAFRNWKDKMDEKYGMICFSENWRSPVLWSHYGEKHHGLCLGFEVPSENTCPVRYQSSRLRIEAAALDEALTMKILTTKFSEWAYEREVRVFERLENSDPKDGNFYMNFGENIKLKEVIVGALNNISRKEVISNLETAGFNTSKIKLTKARLAFNSYAIVTDKRGLC